MNASPCGAETTPSTKLPALVVVTLAVAGEPVVAALNVPVALMGANVLTFVSAKRIAEAAAAVVKLWPTVLTVTVSGTVVGSMA